MATITQIQNINEFVKAFLQTHGVDEEIFDEWKNDENQKAIEALVKSLTKAPAKEKKIKDPNAPKRGKSAYLFFCAEHREKVKADLGEEAKATEVTAELGVRWNALKAAKETGKGAAQKDFDKYTKMAEEDKERYAADMADYTPPSDEELAELAEAKKKGGRGRSPGGSPKPKKDPKAPKRPKSAYLFFCAEVREAVKAELDDPSGKNVMVELGVKWAELKEGAEKGEKDLNRYIKMAEEDKDRYAAEMAEYTPASEDEAEEVVPKKKAPAKKTKSDDEEDEGGAKAAKDKPAKKKTTGYVLFCQEFRPEVKEDNPELPQVEITKLLAEMWKGLPEDEKEEWKEKAAAA
jgi:hypothetical protein